MLVFKSIVQGNKLMAPKISWQIYQDFMIRFHESQASKHGDAIEFLTKESDRLGYAISTLRCYINGNAKKDWFDQFHDEYKPATGSLNFRTVKIKKTDHETPLKHVDNGFIINHEIAMRRWL